jgi:hypothetical protein
MSVDQGICHYKVIYLINNIILESRFNVLMRRETQKCSNVHSTMIEKMIS